MKGNDRSAILSGPKWFAKLWSRVFNFHRAMPDFHSALLGTRTLTLCHREHLWSHRAAQRGASSCLHTRWQIHDGLSAHRPDRHLNLIRQSSLKARVPSLETLTLAWFRCVPAPTHLIQIIKDWCIKIFLFTNWYTFSLFTSHFQKPKQSWTSL